MKKILLLVVTLSMLIILTSCKHTDEAANEDVMVDTSAGIYTLDGKMIISYEQLEKKYRVDLTKDMSSNEIGLFAEILSDLNIQDKIRFVCPRIKKIGDFQFAFVQELIQIELPETVETIGSYAFYQSGLQRIEIPSSVKHIKNNAFDSCKELRDVTLNSGLRIIDVSAFRYIPNLKEIVIPETVEKIGSSAFADTGLTYVKIPETLQVIEDGAFLNTDTLCYNGKINSVDYFGAKRMHEFSHSNQCDICGGSVEYIPYIITQAEFIDENGECEIPQIFRRDNMEFLVTKIDAHAYEGNSEITKVVLPDSIVKIGDCAFKGCTNLQDVILNDTLQEFGQGTFLNCVSLEKIIIPKEITRLGNGFNGCVNLREITLPKGIILYQYDFEGCNNLQTVYFEGTKQEWENIFVEAPAPVMQGIIEQVFKDTVTIITE